MQHDEFTFTSMSDEVLESEIRGLSARVAAAMCRFLLAVAEYDRRGSWERWECHDMAGWLSWKCGVSPITAREHVRVGRALADLPLLRERFAVGALSYSQVRAISRVATAATEETLVDLAQVSTAAQLERITRAYRRCGEAAAEEESSQDQSRYIRYSYDEDGCLVGSFRLPAEPGALLAGAIEAMSDRSAIEEADADGARDPYSAVRADVLVDLVTAGHAALTSGETGDDDRRYLITVITEPAVLSGETDSDEPRLCHVADGPALADQTLRRIACDASIVEIVEGSDGSVLDVGRRTRTINRRMRRALRRRDGRCQFPGCERTGGHAHHLQHWIDGGPTRLDNLVSLCSRHHHRLHEGGYTIRTRPAGGFEFVHPNGWEIPDVWPTAEPTCSTLAWSEPLPYQDGWDGTRLDLGTVVEGLRCRDQRAADSAESSPAPASVA